MNWYLLGFRAVTANDSPIYCHASVVELFGHVIDPKYRSTFTEDTREFWRGAADAVLSAFGF